MGILNEESGDVLLTPYQAEAGRRALGSWSPLPTGRDLLAYWMNREGKAERTILQQLADEGGPLSKSELAARCEYAETGVRIQ